MFSFSLGERSARASDGSELQTAMPAAAVADWPKKRRRCSVRAMTLAPNKK
jgi:hypothetical protein